MTAIACKTPVEDGGNTRSTDAVHRASDDGPVAIAYTPRSFFEAGSEAYRASVARRGTDHGKGKR